MIGGNVNGELQVRSATAANAIGEVVPTWSTIAILRGFLDFANGDSKYTNHKTKIEESTHIFICDYKSITGVRSENARMKINGSYYDVMIIDNPMELNQHLEIYLKFTGD